MIMYNIRKYDVRRTGRRVKRCLACFLAVSAIGVSISPEYVQAGTAGTPGIVSELPSAAEDGMRELWDGTAKEGDNSDVDVTIQHKKSEEGTEAVVTVEAVPSETGRDRGVTKITEVRICENDRWRRGSRTDAGWEFTVSEDGLYSFAVFYDRLENGINTASPANTEDNAVSFDDREYATPYHAGTVYASAPTASETRGKEELIEKVIVVEYGVFDLLRAENVAIDEEHFPDAIFRKLVGQFDLDSDVFLSRTELDAVTEMEVLGYPDGGGYIEYWSVKGLEYFTSLKSFRIANTKVSELDLSHNTDLERLFCNYIRLAEDLDLSQNVNLIEAEVMFFVEGGMEEWNSKLDVSHNTKLKRLVCGGGGLRELDLSHNTELEELWCSDHHLLSIKADNLPNLKKVMIEARYLEELDLSGSPLINELSCGGYDKPERPVPGLTYEQFDLRTLKLHPDITPHILIVGNTKLRELTVNMDYLMMFDCNNSEIEKLTLTTKDRKKTVTAGFPVYGNRLPYLNLEDFIYMVFPEWDITDEPQRVSAYYTKDEINGTWALDMKQLIPKEYLERVAFDSLTSSDQYNRFEGILSLDGIPENQTVSYKYETRADGGNMKLPVDVKLKPVEISAKDVIWVTEEQARDEAYLKQKAGAAGTYGMDDGSEAGIDAADFRYQFVKDGDIVRFVEISATMNNGWETPVMAVTEVRIVPAIEGTNVRLYTGETYSRDQLNISIAGGYTGSAPEIDDAHVDTDRAGTYQVKVSLRMPGDIVTETYFYVQVTGKTRIEEIPALHIRQGEELQEERLLSGVTAVYEKPLEIPETPWTDDKKINNGKPVELLEVPVSVEDASGMNVETVGKEGVRVTAPGMIAQRETEGAASAIRDIYRHGIPVITAFDNELYTGQAAAAQDLEDVVRTGRGLKEQSPVSAYVEYVLPDGQIRKTAIPAGQITCTADRFVPYTAGRYLVTVRADDAGALAGAPVTGLTPAPAEKKVLVTVKEKTGGGETSGGSSGGGNAPGTGGGSADSGPGVGRPAAPEESLSEQKQEHTGSESTGNLSEISEQLGMNRIPLGSLNGSHTGVSGSGKDGKLPRTGDEDPAVPAKKGYNITRIEEDQRTIGNGEDRLDYPSNEVAAAIPKYRNCILHILLLILLALEGTYYIFKSRKDKRIFEKLEKEERE